RHARRNHRDEWDQQSRIVRPFPRIRLHRSARRLMGSGLLSAGDVRVLQQRSIGTGRNLVCLGYARPRRGDERRAGFSRGHDKAPTERKGPPAPDVRAAAGGFATDMTRTYTASWKVSPEQRAIYEAVYTVQEATMAAMRPGALWVDVDRVTVDAMGRELTKLG